MRQAILTANGCPGTNSIEFAPSAFGTIRLTSGELLITDHLTINGPGAANVAVDGNHASRVFEIRSGNNVAIAGLTIANGLASGPSFGAAGGGIFNDHATVTVSDCVLSGNSAGDGGAIYNYGRIFGSAALTVVNCTVSGNQGGGIDNDGTFGGNGTTRIVNSTVTGTSGGPAVRSDGYSGAASVEVVSSIVSSNSLGGIISLRGTLTVSNSAVSGNIEVGVRNEDSIARIVNSVVSDNAGGGAQNGSALSSNTSLQIVSCRLSRNSGSGAIANSRTLEVINSTLSDNSANDGGAIANLNAGQAGVIASARIVNSTLSGNSASSGGAIFNWSFSTNNHVSVQVVNSTLSGNSAQVGGAIHNGALPGGSAAVTVLNSTLSGNSANAIDGIYSEAVPGGSASVELGSTILSAGASGENIRIAGDASTARSLGYNLSSDNGGGVLTNATDIVNTDPKLGPLQDNGGPTLTHAFTCRSAAIDHGKNFSSSPIDQRGLSRIFDDPAAQNAPGGDGTDIGAFEAQVSLPVCDRPPVADASATVPLVISANSINATVILNGSRSSDPDGNVLHYTWYEAGRPAPLASGVVAVTVLPLGIHTIRLVVSDGTLSDTNSVTVEVITAAEAVERLAEAAEEGVSRSAPLRATLAAALASIDRSNPISAINQLLAFQNKVLAQVAPIDPDLAAYFINAAQAIIDALSGGSTNPGGRPHGHFTSVNRQSNGHVRMQFSAEPAGTYIIEASTNLRDWEMIGVATPLPDGSFQFEDGQTARYPTRFYRVRAL